MARNLTLRDLLLYNLHYEVHPILWYALLRFFSFAGVSYIGMHWICGGIGVAGTAILLFLSPFPKYLKLLLPFSYFLLFQYVVVARGYVLVPALLYLLAWCWKKNPILIAVLLGLLANVELHAAVISGGLATVYCIQQIRAGAAKDIEHRKKLAQFVIIVLCFYALCLATTWPAHDLSHWDITTHSRKNLAIVGQSLIWGLCEPILLAIAFWVLAVLRFEERHTLIHLLPILFFAGFSLIYLSFWHAGLIIPLMLCLLWITWPISLPPKAPYEMAFLVVFAAVAVAQFPWSYNAIAYDHNHGYSGDLAAAQFLKPYVAAGTTIAVTYIDQPDNHSYNAVGILPYFDKNIFANWQAAYWWASSVNPSDDAFQSLLSSRPPIIIVETRQVTPATPIEMADPKIQSLLKSGYVATNAFCGTTPYRSALGMTCCHLILQYSGAPKLRVLSESH